MTISWQPACSIEIIQLRAKLLHVIRQYFYAENVLEVETPILCHAIGTDPHLDFFATSQLSGKQQALYLQTSPEFAMKRLLAAQTGSIYQIIRAFRNGESGRLHNPEFSMLEWYRVGYDLAQLMDDVELLLDRLLPADRFAEPAERISYQQVFQQYTGLDALQFDRGIYSHSAKRLGFSEAINICTDDHATWLDFLFSHCVQQHLGETGVCMVYDYPACLPSLARLNTGKPLTVARVEVFIDGIELANGYHELADVKQQESRFDQEIALREKNGAIAVSKDLHFLAALQSGLPDCSGIAMGIDRLLMVISQKNHIDEVLAFPIENA
ncbi:elongation factor P--(R)-beta-lysine ligase [Bathymodiolus japonicus methanotrophic gill symbiont]|uniref:EF-P lysine aminoacylase EpmA n=1 Tax=Bathymodiolus japonicus methanotrophic gill symbiont TaxID=113269 RepID=UPI001B49B6EC|nr:EF-P lysine aminoacylase EpmA [Bathymodiolus japonicus methanotrophic gill symbiont]GFO73141.1 elongation factor P--(R)-beta-lysine ligase [Bathymodiolus japonicus methanotrophic gill symbiont]